MQQYVLPVTRGFLILCKKYKRGVSNRIFAEAESWEQVAFLDVFSTVPDKPYQVVTSEYYDFGSYEVVDQGKNDIVGYNNDLSKVFSAVPIIVYGDHTTIIKYRKTPFIVGGDGIKLLTTHTQNDLQYLYYALCQYNIQPEGYKRHFSIVKNLFIPLPSVEQQHIIAKTLATIDLKINKESDVLDPLKALAFFRLYKPFRLAYQTYPKSILGHYLLQGNVFLFLKNAGL